MQGRFTDRIETFLGIGLLLVAILGFVLLILLNLPKSEEVNSRADILREIPDDIFSSTNPLNEQVNSLQVPTGVPVAIDEGALGRTNVFENF